MLGTTAFESVRWRKGEREHHDQRVSKQGHLNRKVMDSCMGPVYMLLVLYKGGARVQTTRPPAGPSKKR